ncbi:helix-turn-helix domain-containing protein [Fusobacterium animalis]|uniref:helix-turn-helix domain-containing protein n=1 Tax=Fusobacterium TaxID=848 RepID=UPI000518A33E|nr:helix-turn-helix domain-containing protein [Fusobacterium nucleatum]
MSYNKLKGILREKGVSYAELASKINLSVAGLSNKINRKKGSDFTITEAMSIKNYLNLLNEDVYLIFFTK